MKIIKAIITGDAIDFSEPAPADAILVAFDGENYIVYQDGDELPKVESE